MAKKNYQITTVWGALIYLAFIITSVAAWITSIVNCLSNGKWILLLVDILAASVAVIHGIGLWFGVNW